MAATAILSRKYKITIPKGTRVLVMPVPERDQLAGIARGAGTDGYRDRKDRY